MAIETCDRCGALSDQLKELEPWGKLCPSCAREAYDELIDVLNSTSLELTGMPLDAFRRELEAQDQRVKREGLVTRLTKWLR